MDQTQTPLLPAHTENFIPIVRELFREYEAWLAVDLWFQNFEEELRTLPGAYAPPTGRLYTVEVDGDLAGCFALRPLGEDGCEMKRLYLWEGFRGRGLGRLLANRVIEDAKAIGYRSMRLDTLPQMAEAIHLYHALGFCSILPYSHNPVEGALFFELDLTQH